MYLARAQIGYTQILTIGHTRAIAQEKLKTLYVRYRARHPDNGAPRLLDEDNVDISHIADNDSGLIESTILPLGDRHPEEVNW